MIRKVDTSTMFLVGLRDKELLDEPTVAFGVFEAATQEEAVKAAMESDQFARYADKHCRSYCYAIGATGSPLQLNHFYRVPK